MNGFERIAAGASDGFDFLARPEVYAIGSFLLAVVFLVSAYPKLRKPRLAALAIVDFGVMKKVRSEAGLALAFIELSLALALFGAVMASGGGVVLPLVLAALLLWIFVALIARALTSSERFSCFCFGAGDSSLSAWTLVRSTLLAVLATGLVFASGNQAAPALEEVALELATAVSILGTLALLVHAPGIWRENS